jgi:hypothetical protein
MREVCLVVGVLWIALGLAVSFARAEDQPASSVSEPTTAQAGSPVAAPTSPDSPVAQLAPATDPVVALIRTKLADAGLRKAANPADLAALEAFYKARTGGPLWMTDMGFSAKGEKALSEISEADDWGLDASGFDLPDLGALPASHEAAAMAELKLDLAILT